MGTEVSWADVEAAASCGQGLAAFLPREFLVPEQDERNQRPCETINDGARAFPETSGHACNAEPQSTIRSVNVVSPPSTNLKCRPGLELSPLETISLVRAVLAQAAGLQGPALQAAKRLSTLDWLSVFRGPQPPGCVRSTPGPFTAALLRHLLASVQTGAVAAAVMISEIPRLCQCGLLLASPQKSCGFEDATGSSHVDSPPADLVALAHDCCRLVGVKSLTDGQLSQMLQRLGYATCVPWGKEIEQEIWLHHFASHES